MLQRLQTETDNWITFAFARGILSDGRPQLLWTAAGLHSQLSRNPSHSELLSL